MSDQANNLSGKVGLDSTDFKTGIAQMNRDIRVIESGFRASAAALGDWGKTASGLELRIGALGKAMEVQRSKVDALTKEYERVKKEKGENSRAAQELLIKLNKENETLGKQQSELNQTRTALDDMGKESDETGKQVKELGEKQEDAHKKGINWQAGLAGLGGALAVTAKGAAALAAMVAGIAAGIAALVIKSADMAGELVDMSLQTGIGVERLQEMKYIGEQTGTSLDTMTGSLAKLTRNLGNLDNKDVAAAFESLGVNAKDANGNLRSSEAIFGDVITALGGVGNETERDILAMTLFGKSAMELNPLIKAGADEMNRLTDEAHQVGAVVDGETVGALEGFGDKLASLKAGLTGTLATLAGAFLPGLGNLANQAQGYLGKFTEIVTSSGGDLKKMAPQIGELLGTLIQDAIKQIPGMLEAGLSMIQNILTGIVTGLPQLLPGVIGIINQLIAFLIQSLPLLMDAGIQIIMALVKGIGPALPNLISSAIEMIVALTRGLAEAIPQLMPVIATIIPEVIITLIKNLPLLISAALTLIMAIVDGLVIALPILIEYAPKILKALFDAIVKALPIIGKAAVEIYWKLVDGLGKKLPELGQKAGEIVGVIGKGIVDVLSQLWKVGGAIVEGIWGGIEAKRDYFKNQVKAFFQGIVDGIKKALGIQSPSTVFAGIGENMALGLGEGFKASFDDVSKRIAGVALSTTSMPQVSNQYSGGSNQWGGNGKGMGTMTPVTVTINATVANGMDVTALAYRVAEVIQRRGR